MKKQRWSILLIAIACLLALSACKKEQTILEYFDGDKFRMTTGIAWGYYYEPDNAVDGVMAWAMLTDFGFEIVAEEVGLACITFHATIDEMPSVINVYCSTSDGSHTQFTEETTTYNRMTINGEDATKDTYIKIMNEAARNYWNEKSKELTVQISEDPSAASPEPTITPSDESAQPDDHSDESTRVIDAPESKQAEARQITMANGDTVFALGITESGGNLIFSDERFDITNLLFVSASETSLGGYNLKFSGRLESHSSEEWQAVSLSFCLLDASDNMVSDMDAGFAAVNYADMDDWIADGDILDFTVELLVSKQAYHSGTSIGLTGITTFGY